MKFHWKVLLWMAAGALAGVLMQNFLDGSASSGLSVRADTDSVAVASVSGPAAKSKLQVGERLSRAVRNRDSDDPDRLEQSYELREPADFERLMADASNGEVIWVEGPERTLTSIGLTLDSASQRARWIAPFDFIADIFMALLKMLIVPLVLTSIVNGVASVGSLGDLKRLGSKTFGYYIGTSLAAVLLGQLLVNLIRPGEGAVLGLAQIEPGQLTQEASFIDVLRRMIPTNLFSSLGDNGAMLQVIFFSLLFGFFITQTPEPFGSRVRDFFEAAFEVMLRMAQGVLSLLPYGVFALLVRVVATTGYASFKPLFFYMLTVAVALVIHAVVVLPLVLRFVGGISPLRWVKAMAPALMTAFSTSSSSMTLPVTLETVEKRGRVSNKITSFTLPLGATINMDGTALYECIGVVFLAQYYATTGDFELTLGNQALVVFMALMASVGAAGIPSAGLVMMLTILSALGLPLEGAALLLAVDRPLDMLRTVVNVWSDSCGAAVIASSEGESGPSEAMA